MSEFPFPKRLSEQQLSLLRAIYIGLRERGDWPTFQYVDKALDKEGLEVNEVAATLPSGLTNVSVRPMNAGEQAALTIAGLTYLPEARPDLDAFMSVLSYAIERERDYPFTPEGDEGSLITSEELVTRLHLSQEQVWRLHFIFRWEPWHGSGSGTSDQFKFHVTREVRRYRGVKSIEDYVALRQKAYERAFGQVPVAVQTDAVPGVWPRATRLYPEPVPSPGSIDAVAVGRPSKQAFVIMPFKARLKLSHIGAEDLITPRMNPQLKRLS